MYLAVYANKQTKAAEKRLIVWKIPKARFMRF
jgi:hypothetical protein